jgi:hypothetical protein
MPESSVLEGLAELKKHLKEAKETSATKAELTEKFGSIKAEVDKITKAFEEDVKRKTSLSLPDAAPMAKAARELYHKGLKSVRDVVGVRTYDEGSDGRTVHVPIVSMEVRSALFLMDCVYLADQIKGRTSPGWQERKRAQGEREAFLAVFPELGGRYDALVTELKALTTGGAASGAEWIPTGFASSLLDEIRLSNPTINMFPVINMPTNPWVNPMLAGIGQCLLKVEGSNATESNLATRKRTWTTATFANFQSFSYEMEEDSIIAVLPEVRRNILISLNEGLERAIVSGDSDGTHIDFDIQGGSALLPEKAFGGLRKFALDPKGTGSASSHSGAGAQLTVAMIGAAIAKQVKFGLNPMDSAILVNAADFMGLLTEAGSPVLTRDKFGPQATIETGALAALWGRPIFVSNGVERRRDAVAATGVNTNAGPNTFSTALVLNRQNFRLGDRRKVTVEDDRDIVAGVVKLVGSARWAFQSLEGDMTDANFNPLALPAVVAIINIA